jgi:hypothetical protein
VLLGGRDSGGYSDRRLGVKPVLYYSLLFLLVNEIILFAKNEIVELKETLKKL